MRATQHEAINALIQQRPDVLAYIGNIVEVQAFNLRCPSRTGFNNHFHVARMLFDKCIQACAVGRGFCGEHANAPRDGTLRCWLDAGFNAYHRNAGMLLAQCFNGGGGGGVAGDNQQGAAGLDEFCANGEHSRLNIGFAFIAVGHVCAVGEVNEVGAWQGFDQSGQHREAAQAGIKDTDHL